MAGPSNLIKAQIKANLDALVTAGTLGAVVEQDINTNIFDIDFPGFPCAVLGTSDMRAVWEYQQNNKITYKYDVLVVQLYENLASMGDMEDLRDDVALRFDNNVTLAGTAPLGVEAVASEAVTYVSKGRTYALFNVTIRATTLRNLTYNF